MILEKGQSLRITSINGGVTVAYVYHVLGDSGAVSNMVSNLLSNVSSQITPISATTQRIRVVSFNISSNNDSAKVDVSIVSSSGSELAARVDITKDTPFDLVGFEFNENRETIGDYSEISGLIPWTGTNERDAASINTLLIQSAMGSVGKWTISTPGTYFINRTLVVSSGVELLLHPDAEIKALGAGVGNLLQSKAYASTKTNVTVAWSSGYVATVTWTAHGLTTSDLVWLDGSTESPFRGVFRIQSITDANTFIVQLKRLPSGAPTGQATAIKADKKITIQGGTWNYNFSGGNDEAFTGAHCIVLGGVYNVTVKDIRGRDSKKFVVNLGAINIYRIENIVSEKLNSDNCKVYGPAFNGTIDTINSDGNDDLISLQVREPAAFSGYRWTYGDIIGANVNNLGGRSSTGMMILYGDSLGIVDNIVVNNLTAEALPGFCIRVDAEAGNAAQFGCITFNNPQLRSATGLGNTFLSIGGGGGNLLTWQNIIINNPTYHSTANTGRLVSISAGAQNGQITIIGGYATGTENIVNNSSTGTVTINIVGMTIGASWNTFSISNAAGITNLNIDGMNHAANPGSNWLNTGSTPTINTRIRGLSLPTPTPVINKVGGAFLRSFSPELLIDLTKLDRAVPGQFATSVAASGTIVNNNVAVNDATNAAGSWKQLSNTANNF